LFLLLVSSSVILPFKYSLFEKTSFEFGAQIG